MGGEVERYPSCGRGYDCESRFPLLQYYLLIKDFFASNNFGRSCGRQWVSAGQNLICDKMGRGASIHMRTWRSDARRESVEQRCARPPFLAVGSPGCFPPSFLLSLNPTATSHPARPPPTTMVVSLSLDAAAADASLRRQVAALSSAVIKSKRIVVVTGAGISCSCGIPVRVMPRLGFVSTLTLFSLSLNRISDHPMDCTISSSNNTLTSL